MSSILPMITGMSKLPTTQKVLTARQEREEDRDGADEGRGVEREAEGGQKAEGRRARAKEPRGALHTHHHAEGTGEKSKAAGRPLLARRERGHGLRDVRYLKDAQAEAHESKRRAHQRERSGGATARDHGQAGRLDDQAQDHGPAPPPAIGGAPTHGRRHGRGERSQHEEKPPQRG